MFFLNQHWLCFLCHAFFAQVMPYHAYPYASAAGTSHSDSGGGLEAQLDAENSLLHKQHTLAEVTGVPGTKELELMLNADTCTNARRWAVENWGAPESYETLQAWVTELVGLEELPWGAVTYKSHQPGEVDFHFTLKWCIAKLMHCNWCVNSVQRGKPEKQVCYCLTATSFMPTGCTHKWCGPMRFPQIYCVECSKCLRCNKHLEAVRVVVLAERLMFCCALLCFVMFCVFCMLALPKALQVGAKHVGYGTLHLHTVYAPPLTVFQALCLGGMLLCMS